MQLLEVSDAVRPIYGSLGVKRLRNEFQVRLIEVNYIHIFSEWAVQNDDQGVE